MIGRGLKWLVGVVGALLLVALGAIAGDYVPGLRDRALDPPVLLAFAEVNQERYADGYALIFAKHADAERAVERANGCGTLLEPSLKAGGVLVEPLWLRLVLEGRGRGVTLVDVGVRKIHEGKPLRGSRILCAGGGDLPPIGLAFDLDEDEPVARRTPGGAPYFGRGNAIDLQKDEVQIFAVFAYTRRQYVEWELEIRALVDGKPRTIRVDYQGEPFRVTGSRCGERAYGPSYINEFGPNFRPTPYGDAFC